MAAASRFIEAAQQLGLEPEIREFPEGTHTAGDAAAAIGCDVAQIVKSLVSMAGDEAVLILTSGANRVDESSVAQALGVAEIRKASADQVRDATSFAIGATPPFGHPAQLPTVMDQDLLGHDEVWAAAGTADTCFPIRPTTLSDVTSAVICDVQPGRND